MGQTNSDQSTLRKDEVMSDRILNIETPDVVQICDNWLYVKSAESLPLLIKELESLGYEVKESIHRDFEDLKPGDEGYRERRSYLEKIPTYLWYAHFREDVLQQKGVCGHCGALIDTITPILRLLMDL
jgi:hypothetical protein